MQIISFASGSTGNCTLVSTGNTHILIDVGISMRRIKTSLSGIGLDMRELSGILITHEHTDHVSGLAMMTKYYNIPVYAPRTVANHLRWSIAGVDECIREIKVGEPFSICKADVRAFATPHDTPESVGYRIEADVSFGFCTDLGHVTDEVLCGLCGVDAVVIEANHDVEMLRCGQYPYYLKRRILSDNGHLSNDSSGELAVHIAKSGARQIMLGHLSRENNRPELARTAVADALAAAGFKAGIDLTLEVAAPCDTCMLSIQR
jgi:phosphoribosyl 1,2-cyclic phosphodiesterase